MIDAEVAVLQTDGQDPGGPRDMEGHGMTCLMKLSTVACLMPLGVGAAIRPPDTLNSAGVRPPAGTADRGRIVRQFIQRDHRRQLQRIADRTGLRPEFDYEAVAADHMLSRRYPEIRDRTSEIASGAGVLFASSINRS